MKYIMYEHKIGDVKQRIPIIFPNNLVHSIVDKQVRPALQEHGFAVEPVSAGSVVFHQDIVVCAGFSDTMGLSAQDEDADIIGMIDYFHGMVDG